MRKIAIQWAFSTPKIMFCTDVQLLILGKITAKINIYKIFFQIINPTSSTEKRQNQVVFHHPIGKNNIFSSMQKK